MDEKVEKKTKRIGIDMPLGLALEVKMLATRRNCTVRRWLLRAIIEYIQKEKRFDVKG